MADPGLPGIPAGSRLVVIPDTDGDLGHSLGVLEEVLLQLQPNDDDDDDDLATPGLGLDELHALQRVAMRVFAAERAETADLYRAGAKPFQYLPLRFVTLLVEDLALVGRAITVLGLALHDPAYELAREAMASFCGQRQGAGDLVVEFAQAHGVLDLAPDDDMILLASTLANVTGPVVLSAEQDLAYVRYTDRVLAMHLNSPFDRFLFRGP
jgi:hypothetical protein